MFAKQVDIFRKHVVFMDLKTSNEAAQPFKTNKCGDDSLESMLLYRYCHVFILDEVKENVNF